MEDKKELLKYMEQEDKDLLLKDLCARLTYGVKGTVPVTITLDSYDMEGFHEDIDKDTDVELISVNCDGELEVSALEENISETVFYQLQAEPWSVEEINELKGK